MKKKAKHYLAVLVVGLPPLVLLGSVVDMPWWAYILICAIVWNLVDFMVAYVMDKCKQRKK